MWLRADVFRLDGEEECTRRIKTTLMANVVDVTSKRDCTPLVKIGIGGTVELCMCWKCLCGCNMTGNSVNKSPRNESSVSVSLVPGLVHLNKHTGWMTEPLCTWKPTMTLFSGEMKACCKRQKCVVSLPFAWRCSSLNDDWTFISGWAVVLAHEILLHFLTAFYYYYYFNSYSGSFLFLPRTPKCVFCLNINSSHSREFIFFHFFSISGTMNHCKNALCTQMLLNTTCKCGLAIFKMSIFQHQASF